MDITIAFNELDICFSCAIGEMDYASLEMKDDKGITPLIYATILRKREIADILLTRNPDVTVIDSFGLSALHWAALHLDDKTLQLICDHTLDSDVDVLDASGRSALFLACAEGKDESGVSESQALIGCINALVELGADADLLVEGAAGACLHFLASSWQDSAVTALLRGRCSVSLPTKDGDFALHMACRGVSIRSTDNEMTRILFGKANKEDRVPVESEYGLGTLRVLLRAGAQPNAKDGSGLTPLQALLEGKENWGDDFSEAVELLVSHGARLISDSTFNAELRLHCSADVIEEAIAEWNSKEAINIDALELEYSFKILLGLHYSLTFALGWAHFLMPRVERRRHSVSYARIASHCCAGNRNARCASKPSMTTAQRRDASLMTNRFILCSCSHAFLFSQ